MIDTQERPAALTWQSCWMASLLASLPIFLAMMLGSFVERTDFPSNLFGDATVNVASEGFGIDLGVTLPGLLFWLAILYFFRRRDLKLRAAILIGILIAAIVISVVLTYCNIGTDYPFWDIIVLVTVTFGIPSGVLGGLLAWFYVRQARKKPLAP
jgi:hypothetical protein